MVIGNIGVKPTRPELNRGHSLARDLIFCLPFEDRGGDTHRNYSNLLRRQYPEDSTSTHIRGPYGGSVSFAESVTHVNFGPDNTIVLPTREATICVIYEKNDGTNRVSGLFGHDSGGNPIRIGAAAPWSDGNIYWDFGGSSGDNRLTTSGQTFERAIWVYTAGPRGMELWKNGALLNSSSTAVTRSTSGSAWGIGRHGSLAGDNVTYHFFALFDRQFERSETVAFSSNPFALITPPERKSYFVPTVVVAAPETYLRRYEGAPAPNTLLRM